MQEHYLETDRSGESLRYDLAEGRVHTIGRSDQNAIVLNNDGVSRFHALVQSCGPGSFLITDRGSSNGTYVNGTRVSTSLLLKDGDRITIGSDEFIFKSTQERPAPHVEADCEKESMSTRMFVAQKLMTVLVVD